MSLGRQKFRQEGKIKFEFFLVQTIRAAGQHLRVVSYGDVLTRMSRPSACVTVHVLTGKGICKCREFLRDTFQSCFALFKGRICLIWRDKGVRARPVTGLEHVGMRLGRRETAATATQQQRQRRTSVSRVQMARHFVHPWIICGAMPNASTSASQPAFQYACVQPALRTRILRLYACTCNS